MRKAEREITSRTEIEEVLLSALVLRLGLIAEGEPYVVPVNYGYQDGALWFHSALEGRKVDAMRANPLVAFEVEADVEVAFSDKPCGCTVKYRSVTGVGRAHFIEDPLEKTKGLDILMRQHGRPGGGYGENVLSRTLVVRIDIEKMTGKKHLG